MKGVTFIKIYVLCCKICYTVLNNFNITVSFLREREGVVWTLFLLPVPG